MKKFVLPLVLCLVLAVVLTACDTSNFYSDNTSVASSSASGTKNGITPTDYLLTDNGTDIAYVYSFFKDGMDCVAVVSNVHYDVSISCAKK